MAAGVFWATEKVPLTAAGTDHTTLVLAGRLGMEYEAALQITAAPEITGLPKLTGVTKFATFVVVVVMFPKLFGSSQLLNLVALVPPPVHETSKRPPCVIVISQPGSRSRFGLLKC